MSLSLQAKRRVHRFFGWVCSVIAGPYRRLVWPKTLLQTTVCGVTHIVTITEPSNPCCLTFGLIATRITNGEAPDLPPTTQWRKPPIRTRPRAEGNPLHDGCPTGFAIHRRPRGRLLPPSQTIGPRVQRRHVPAAGVSCFAGHKSHHHAPHL